MLYEVDTNKFCNVFKTVGEDKMLITAGKDGRVNTMTAGWGCFGILWNMPVAMCFIRPERYTYGFTEKSDFMSMSFFGGERREALAVCGSTSGRNTDKIRAAGLHIAFCGDTPYISEAHTVLVCRKIYSDDLRKERIILPEIEKYYTAGGYHRMYICGIEKVLSDHL